MGHALARVNDGFDIDRMVAEFRALRASVSRLWWDSLPEPHKEQIDDMGRFHEALDQLVAASLRAFTSRLEKSRRLFLGILGHDLRQPLYSIKMYSEVLLKSDSPADLRPLYASIGRCSDAMATLLADLLEFTSARLGTPMPIYPIPCHMGAIANEVIEEFRASFPARDFIFETEGDLKGIWDTTRLRQLVSNLLSNARQHGAPDGPITAMVRESGGKVSLSVHNWGKPIPNDAIGTLFDPMVRIADDDKPRPHGSIGLGLYICRQIVIAHHGNLAVHSSHADGTTFTVNLPRFGSEAG
jgi:signal transduction histidine kinase